VTYSEERTLRTYIQRNLILRRARILAASCSVIHTTEASFDERDRLILQLQGFFLDTVISVCYQVPILLTCYIRRFGNYLFPLSFRSGLCAASGESPKWGKAQRFVHSMRIYQRCTGQHDKSTAMAECLAHNVDHKQDSLKRWPRYIISQGSTKGLLPIFLVQSGIMV